MGYFKVFAIDSKTWYIREPLGVGSFLFEGDERALLLDTCNGFRDIRPTIGKLTSKPLTVVNSHGHADHAGGNVQFPEIYIHSADADMLAPAFQKSQRDLLFGYAKTHYPFLRPLLFWIERSKHTTLDTKARFAEDGHVFDLGERTLKVIHCPGHTPGSIILTDEWTKTLYVGDAVNPGLFLFFEDSPKLKDYAAQLRRLAIQHGYDFIRISHSKRPLPFSFIAYYADFLERATSGNSVVTDIPNSAGDVYKYSEDGKAFGLKEIAVHYTKDLLE
jgi:glyoxylase-like metal-dependent hydrolase (beta-lactamase superfamily II)